MQHKQFLWCSYKCSGLFAVLILSFAVSRVVAKPDGAKKQDRTPPMVGISWPTAKRVTYLEPISGWVKDNPGGSGVALVYVRIYRLSKGHWLQWGGYKWSRGRPESLTIQGQGDYYVKANVQGSAWSYKFVPHRSIPLDGYHNQPSLLPGLYRIKVIAYDNASNSKTVVRRVKVTADMDLPNVRITQPRAGSSFSRFPVIRGRASDTGGSGLDKVQVSIYFRDGGQSWTGTRWIQMGQMRYLEQDAVTAKRKGNDWWLDQVPHDEQLQSGDYSIEAYAYDKAGNRSDLMAWRDVDHPHNDGTAGYGGVRDTTKAVVVHIRR